MRPKRVVRNINRAIPMTVLAAMRTFTTPLDHLARGQFSQIQPLQYEVPFRPVLEALDASDGQGGVRHWLKFGREWVVRGGYRRRSYA
jgi:hypothetical protein